MSVIVGNEKQEEKIVEMGNIAHSMFPEISIMSFKGVFRYGIQGALKKQGAENWNDIAELEPSTRQQFFERLLQNSISKLKNLGLTEFQIKSLFDRLKKENRKYSKNVV